MTLHKEIESIILSPSVIIVIKKFLFSQPIYEENIYDSSWSYLHKPSSFIDLHNIDSIYVYIHKSIYEYTCLCT